MGWKVSTLGVLLALLGAAGCHCRCSPDAAGSPDGQQIQLPPNLACDPTASVLPVSGSVPAPTTVVDTTREPRYLSLREAIALALEHGTVGTQAPLGTGLANDLLPGFLGTPVGGSLPESDSIRVLALDPAIVGTAIDSSLSKFDVQWNTSLTWTKSETPIGTVATLFQAGAFTGAPLPFEAINQDEVTFTTALVKPLPTGGVAGITFSTDYTHNNINFGVNPAYQPALQFNFEQPLLQGFGVEINQLRAAHPGSLLTPFPTTNLRGVEGILITRIRLDEQRAELERNLHYLLLNVETAYWNLYGSYYQLYAREEAMRLAFEVWRLNNRSYEVGHIPSQKLEQARVQFELFRSQRLTALAQIQENERNLRGLLGLRVEDGSRLVPTDAPPLTPFAPDWKSALDEALALRPELVLARQELKFRQLDLIRSRDATLPDLRLTLTDNLHALGGQIDGGPNPSNAFHELASDPFNTVSLGVRMNVPLGFRDANAVVRASQLALARSYQDLRTNEERAERVLGLAYRQVFEFWAQIEIEQAAVRAAQAQVADYLKQISVGRATYADTDLFLAQRDLSDSQVSLYQYIVQYATALAALEFARGTIMQYDSVYVAEGLLPKCVQVRAVEHERQRTRALVLSERRQAAAPGEGSPLLRALHAPPPIPVLFEDRPPLPSLPVGSEGEAAKQSPGQQRANDHVRGDGRANRPSAEAAQRAPATLSFEEIPSSR